MRFDDTNKSLRILLWRNWEPIYEFPATFSCLSEQSIGGTCSQLLWHAQNLIELGHLVQVMGVTRQDIRENKVEFIGSSTRSDQEKLMASEKVSRPDVIVLEGAFSAAKFFRLKYPEAMIVHIGQNIDRYGHQAAFAEERFIDVYAYVGLGQLADYCARFPAIRHKFMLVRNIVPWESVYKSIEPVKAEDHVAWVGAWTKKGLRQWSEVMETFLKEHPSYRWTLFGPSHGAHIQGVPRYVLGGLKFEKGRVVIKSLPLAEMAREISSARIVLVSLGNECGPISILDAHAMGRPVLSGNDMVYKYSNPEGTGIRVSNNRECNEALSTLIRNPELCYEMGELGKKLVLSTYVERNQRQDFEQVLGYLRVKHDLAAINENSPNGEVVVSMIELRDMLKRKILSIKPSSI